MPSKFAPDGQYQSNLDIRVGSTFNKTYKWGTGTPVVGYDLSDWTAKSHIRAKLKDEEYLLELSTENGRIELTATGDVTLMFSEADTLLFGDYKKAVFDVELFQPATGFKKNLVGGTITFWPEVTRDTP